MHDIGKYESSIPLAVKNPMADHLLTDAPATHLATTYHQPNPWRAPDFLPSFFEYENKVPVTI
jgi:hypothetical protein